MVGLALVGAGRANLARAAPPPGRQSIMGGTGANFIALVTGDAGYFDAGGQRGPAVKPCAVPVPWRIPASRRTARP